MMPRPARGFTLLEVLVALTITGLALGALLGVIGGSKRLAWRSEAALLDVSRARVQINLAQLADTPGALPPLELREVPRGEQLRLEQDLELEPPARKTLPGTSVLRRYELRTPDGELLSAGVHWTELGLPQ